MIVYKNQGIGKNITAMKNHQTIETIEESTLSNQSCQTTAVGYNHQTFGCERSSVGRASPCQGERRGFKSLRSLHFFFQFNLALFNLRVEVPFQNIV
jgi:hypothetical protein